MSHAGMIIGIPCLEIEQVKRGQGIEVWARPVRRVAMNLIYGP